MVNQQVFRSDDYDINSSLIYIKHCSTSHEIGLKLDRIVIAALNKYRSNAINEEYWQ